MKSWKWNNLKELVESLTVNEKRYFKMHINDVSSKNYIKLFDALNNKLDDKAFKKELSQSNINISYEKSYLFKVILKNLRNFHESSSIDAVFHQALLDIEVLMNKKLLTFCYEYIQYHIDLAIENECYLFLLQLNKWKRKCIIRLGDIQKQIEFTNEEHQLDQECFLKLNNHSEIRLIQQKILVIINQKGNSMSEKDRLEIKKIANHPILKSEKNALSKLALLIWYEIKVWSHFYNSELDIAFSFSSKMIQTIEANEFIVNSYPQMYLAALANHFNRAYKLDKNELLDPILKKIEEMAMSKASNIPDDIKNEAFAYSSERRILQFANEKNYLKTIEQFNINKKYFTNKKYKFKPSYYILQYYFCAYASFHIKDYDLTVKCIKEILDNHDDKIRLDFILYTKVLNILLQYQLGNYTLIPHLYKSLIRQLDKNKVEVKIIDIACSALVKLSKNQMNKNEVKNILLSLEHTIIELEKIVDEEVVIDTIGLKEWLYDNLLNLK